ncbi:mediator complex subunit 13 C-terminal-domain-containing protein [Umbelopsis sp. AD052]|nr:mediator complex subunit 13 C-terminal-domain-containing protein [Umbelopsis sp. AD052]
MVSDASLTNILQVSGILQIRLRVYQHVCKRQELTSYKEKKSESYQDDLEKAEPSNVPLIAAYRSIMRANIPAFWRTLDVKDDSEEDDTAKDAEDNVRVELWVFWIDDKHTGIVDRNPYLNELEEVKVTSFSWENIFAATTSPTTSPISPVAKANTTPNTSLTQDYRFFIKAVRNLICLKMVNKGTIPLGDFFIYPTLSNVNVMDGVLTTESTNTSTTSSADQTLPSCTFNLYLTSTNLIFQPVIRRLRIRRLRRPDFLPDSSKTVLLAPLGLAATLKSSTADLSAQTEDALLWDWASMLNIPYENLTKTAAFDASMSALVMVQCGEEVFPYPSALIFVSTSTKFTPSSISGLDGLGFRNHGLIEEMSEKYNRWAWEERIAEIAIKKGAEEAFGTGAFTNAPHDRKNDVHARFNASFQTLPTPTDSLVQTRHTDAELTQKMHPRFTVDFWDFTNPTTHVTSTVLNHASMPDPFGSPTLLQNVMTETLSSNVLMTPKVSRTPRRSTGTYNSGKLQPTISHTWEVQQPNTKDFMAQMNTDLDMNQHLARKQEHPDGTYPNVSSYPYTAQTPTADIKTEVLAYSGASIPTSQPKTVTTAQDLSGLQITMNEPAATDITGGHFAPTTTGMPMNLGTTDSAAGSNYPSPHDHLGGGNADMSFGMDNLGGYDQMVYGLSSAWEEGVGDMDNFDLDVTEEDFDFFESTPTTKSRPAGKSITSVSAPPPTSLTSAVSNPVSSLPSNALDAPIMTDLNLSAEEVEKHENLDLDELLMATNGFLDDPMKAESDLNMGQGIVTSQVESVSIEQENIMNDGTVLDSSLVTDIKDEEQTSDVNITSTLVEDVQQTGEDESLLDPDALMPPEFAPLPVTAGVDDAKYYNGGKFVYSPSKKRKKEGGAVGIRRSAYKPDYMPHVRKKTTDGPFKTADIRKKYNGSEQAKVDTTLHPATLNNDAMVVPDETSLSDSSDDSSSDSSSSSSDTDMEDAEEMIRATSRLDITSGLDRQYLKVLNKVKLMLLAWSAGDYSDKSLLLPNSQQTLRLEESIDYDVPFAQVVTREPLYDRPSEERHTSDGHMAAVELLCQQAVLGGYPFVGNIAEISQRGGDFIDGESMQVAITRRRNLIQSNCGAVTSVPSLSDEMDSLTSDFKDVLSNIFDFNKTPEYTHLQIGQHPLPTTIGIKGPLNVQQYYELSDTTQTQSKYGKYQVKKRKPVEPNLDMLRPPSVVVGRQDEWIEGSPHMLTFWEKLRLEPYSTKKNIVYFALCPDSDGFESMAIDFFNDLSAVYEICLLGTHHPGVAGDRKRGVVPVPLLVDNEDPAGRRLRSYQHAAQRLGATIGNMGQEGVYYVIYMINPFSHSSSLLDLSQCFQSLVVAFNTSALGTTFSDKTRPRLVMQLVPVEHVLRPTAFGGYNKFGLKEIAFSVYSKCSMVVERAHQQSRAQDMQSVTELYAPPFVLAKPPPTSIQYSTKNAYKDFPSALEHDVTMHIAYTFSIDNRWAIAVWIDARGEMIDFMVQKAEDHTRQAEWQLHAIKEIWERTKHLCGRAGFSWKFTIGKLGLMFGNELADWIATVNNEENISILALDYDSPFRVSHESDSTMGAESSNTPSSSSGTPTPETFTPGATPSMNIGSVSTQATPKSADIFEPESGESHALLVNHRMAYSRRRQLTSSGILLNQDVAEQWMLPLASAYLLQVPVKAPAPSREQFSLETQAIELHLIHMQSTQTAASVLREIVKQYHSLSYLNTASASSNCIPLHFVLVDRLCRLLYTVAA